MLTKNQAGPQITGQINCVLGTTLWSRQTSPVLTRGPLKGRGGKDEEENVRRPPSSVAPNSARRASQPFTVVESPAGRFFIHKGSERERADKHLVAGRKNSYITQAFKAAALLSFGRSPKSGGHRDMRDEERT